MSILDLTPEKETPITEEYLFEHGWYKMVRSFTTVWRLSKLIEYNADSQPHFLGNVCSEIYIKIPIWGQIQIESLWSTDEYRKAQRTYYESWWRRDVNHYLNDIKKIIDDIDGCEIKTVEQFELVVGNLEILLKTSGIKIHKVERDQNEWRKRRERRNNNI
jgi:hypothetical protein